ncbi:ATP-grasp domain-containing protein, partial [Nesterenkonia alkaliphila]|nr:ATP-grasp domain-containing protein [Nesterenkonia alkaliphila]
MRVFSRIRRRVCQVCIIGAPGQQEVLMEAEWPEHFQPEVVKDGFGGKLTSYTIALEAWRRGLQVTFLDPELRKYRIQDDSGNAVTFIRSRPHMTTWDAVRVANNKFKTNAKLRAAGIPVPESAIIEPSQDTLSVLKERARGIGYPVVIKPLKGSMGHGVFSGISDEQMLEDRYRDLIEMDGPAPIVMESHIVGEDYRVLVYSSRVVAACKRVPANILGDGESTVETLVERKNALRRKNPFLSKGLIKHDREVEDYLRRQGHTLSSVPARGEYLQLRSAANASAGGDVIDVTWNLPRELRQAAVKATQAIPDLYCAGVDILFNDHAGQVEGNYAIIELNAHPQIGVNMYPTQGQGVDVPRHILDECFPDSRRSCPKNVASLYFPLNNLLGPLHQGAIEAISPRPLARHRYSMRLSLVSDEALKVTADNQQALARL